MTVVWVCLVGKFSVGRISEKNGAKRVTLDMLTGAVRKGDKSVTLTSAKV